ncbi:MAG: flavin reductase family protein [Candidatus Krumholzibacteriota bacterium]|nr:flavin reductase family protein [Candidatus Krumholzibacteriota bacterium]
MNDKTAFTGSFILAPVPVVLVGCGHQTLGRNVITIAWCGVGCSDPETINVSIRPERHSHRMIRESGCFTVNIPTPDLLDAVVTCGTVSGREKDKFALAGLTPLDGETVKAPIVAECPVNIECRVLKVVPLGAHDMFIGRVSAKRADAGHVTDGRISFERIPLVAYVNGRYRLVGDPVAP